ncbi:Tol-Pal system beta propeller repeat protein TolB [Thiomicrospira sp. ALE5]|uniref:Tol-Pal system beta propeller repeat protein TolB n=1 Tax=Thiomicrospira sp. ALE5 TaxID=748650 RepID=UPI0008EDCAA2|nr:Tol-Pal system beta propeller repeat protein TolB [Thiomicrospira sp. ALE5]SFR51113.1 TolB protein [Thiomicrospira sp. ALE5]
MRYNAVRYKFASWTAGLVMLMASQFVQANLVIEITEGFENAIPVAVVPFNVEGRGAAPQDVGEIIQNNLRRSGRFAPVATNRLPQRPTAFEAVVFEQWQRLDVDHLIMGQLILRPDGSYDIDVRLVDVLRRQQVLAKRYQQVPANRLRQAAHQISDELYHELTGVWGAFNTRLAYVTVREEGNERSYSLDVSDSDGHNPRTVLRSRMPIMSPRWSPDGRQIAYVSFEAGRSIIVLQSLDGRSREVIAEFTGINSTPVWSPDGRQLAMTLSKDGSANLYVMNMANRQLRQLTNHPAIDTEPSWSPDGAALYFNSDRRGQPQIFKLDLATNVITRVSFEGRYNASPMVSPNGRHLAMVHANNGFNIGIMDLTNGDFRQVTRTSLAESPSFAPNSDMLVYATNNRGRGELAVISVDGRASQVLRVQDGQVREPAWGPYLTPPRMQ